MKPLVLKNPLAGNPSKGAQFCVSLERKNGKRLDFVDPRATRALVALMDMAAVMGGAASHFGGPAAFAELMSAIYGIVFDEASEKKQNWFDLFHVVNDAGHCENGLYALKANYEQAGLNLEKLKGFRSLKSPLTGHGEVHAFPEGVWISNGPLGSGLPQAQGLAMADALAGHERITVCTISDGASFEGEAKEAYAAIPGYAAKGQINPFICILSDNNTKLSGRIDEESFEMNKYFDSLETQGWHVINCEKGNDLQTCINAFEIALETVKKEVPVLIHAKTIKGFGTQKTMTSNSGGHGFPLKDPSELKDFIAEIYDGENIPSEFVQWMDEMVDESQKSNQKIKAKECPTEKVQVGISKAMIEQKRKGVPLVSISADLPGSTGVKGFQKEYPESSYDVGVAEANMFSVGAGFSKVGFVPIVDTFAQFGVTKGALPLIMGGLSEAPLIAVLSHTGYQDAADGASHQALTYFAKVSAIPGVDVYCLTCSEEAEVLMSEAIEQFVKKRESGEVPRTVIFFLGRENFPKCYVEGKTYQLGQPDVYPLDQSQICVAVTGPLLWQALEAQRQLKEEGIAISVFNPSCINNPNIEVISKIVKKSKGCLVTLEDHRVVGGMGGLLSHALLRAGIEFKVISLGIGDSFGRSAYTASDLYMANGLDTAALVKEIKQKCL